LQYLGSPADEANAPEF